jgi:hypothetical protein
MPLSPARAAAAVIVVVATAAVLLVVGGLPATPAATTGPSATAATAIGTGLPAQPATSVPTTLPLTPGPSPAPSTVPSAGPTSAPTPAPPAPTPRSTATPAPPSTPKPTEPPPAAGVVLVGAGDIADCGSTGDSATANVIDDIAGTVFTLGDNAYENGTLMEFNTCYGPTWGRFKSRTHPAPGNHEYNTPNAAGYFDYFGARAGDPDEGWYAYNLGTWRIYALNSNCSEIGGCGAGSAQVAWLKADLLAHPHQCTLAYWHHPRFSSGPHGNNAATDGLWDALYAADAEIVLSGHDHDYERFAPMSGNGSVNAARGMVEFVVGTGGREHYAFLSILPTSRARNSTAWGVLKLTLSPGSWTSRFVPIAGRTYSDTASGTCH